MDKIYKDYDLIVETIWKYTSFTDAEKSRIINAINDVSPADVVEVVRCKECKWARGIDYNTFCYCESHNGIMRNIDFCSRGERKETI